MFEITQWIGWAFCETAFRMSTHQYRGQETIRVSAYCTERTWNTLYWIGCRFYNMGEPHNERLG